MTLEQWSAAAQIVSAVAVIASLVFVGFQVKNAVGAIRAGSSLAHAGDYTTLVGNLINNADFARIWFGGITDPDALADDEWVRFLAYASAQLRLYESAYVQWSHGWLSNEHWYTIERHAADYCSLPGLQVAWKVRGHWFSPQFRRWFERLHAPAEAKPYARG